MVPILEKNPYHVILHVGTNDVVHHEETKIINKLLKLKSFIVEQLSATHVVTSLSIPRTHSK